MDAAELLARCDFGDDDELALGVSGGADSTAMALLAAEAGRSFRIWHVHHGLRDASDAEVELVAKLASSLGMPFELRRLELTDGPDLEATAREARYAVLPPDVCVAHTADDRAETVLFNLLRGAGLAGVAAPFARVRRPIIGLRRAETRALCEFTGVAVVDDPMNDDPRFARVVVRKQLLPAAANALGRDPVPLLNRHADLVADALIVIQDAAAALDATDTAALRAAPRAVASESLRQWLMAETGNRLAVDAASISRVMDVVVGTARATEVEGGFRVARTAGRLRAEPPPGGNEVVASRGPSDWSAEPPPGGNEVVASRGPSDWSAEPPPGGNE
ncbi:MAG: tRNA lysidine(34) synthetase TilS [Acidimicrobiaceae bacterium]|nr:tRNA lysidine(34) synthetase TilS [Acidimicrobiaceae bacterium]